MSDSVPARVERLVENSNIKRYTHLDLQHATAAGVIGELKLKRRSR